MTPEYSRRRLLAAGVGLGVAGLAGCVGDSEGQAGHFEVALSWDVTSETWTDGFGGVSPYFTNAYETLVGATAALDVEPRLATDWQRTDDVTWEFTLRSDGTFHDGEPLTASDVVSSVETLFERGSYGWLHLEESETRALDDRTVEFTTEQPFPAFPDALTHPLTAIHRNPGPDGEVVGTGPLAVRSVERGHRVETEAFEDYWGTTPTVEGVTFKIVQDDSTRALELESGDADIAYELPRSQVPRLEQADEIEVSRTVAPHVIYAGIHCYQTPTSDRTLRRALNHAIDQETIVDTVLEGVGEPARGPISPAIPWSAHDEVPTYEYDPERARELVAESVYDDEVLELLVSTDVVVDGGLIAESMQAALSDVGVSVEIRQTERSAFFDEMDHADLSLLHYGSNNAGADYRIYQSFHTNGVNNHANYERDGTGLYNLGGEVDELIERGHRTGGDERKNAYRTAQRRIVDEAVVIPISYKAYAVGAQAPIDGLELHPIDKLVDVSQLRSDDAAES